MRKISMTAVSAVSATRLALCGGGLLVMAYGGLRLAQHTQRSEKIGLAKWLAGMVIVHDGLIAPAVVAIGWLLARTVQPRARAYVQGGLAVAGMTVLFSLPLLYRHGKSQPGTTLLTRDYARSVVTLLVLILVVTAGLYATAVIRDARRSNSTNERPAADHEPTE